jgi:hypothetical protein
MELIDTITSRGNVRHIPIGPAGVGGASDLSRARCVTYPPGTRRPGFVTSEANATYLKLILVVVDTGLPEGSRVHDRGSWLRLGWWLAAA